YLSGLNDCISSCLILTRFNVGVCTLPQDNCASYLVVSARVAFIPTIQSASLLHNAALYKLSYALPGFKFLNPSLISFSLTELIHNLFIGFFILAFSIINLATNSPSRPASVAMIID